MEKLVILSLLFTILAVHLAHSRSIEEPSGDTEHEPHALELEQPHNLPREHSISKRFVRPLKRSQFDGPESDGSTSSRGYVVVDLIAPGEDLRRREEKRFMRPFKRFVRPFKKRMIRPY